MSPFHLETNASSNSQAGTGAGTQNRLIWQHVSAPLAPGTLSGTVKGQCRALETNTTDDYWPQMNIRLVSFDGTVIRGTAMALHTNAISSELATSLTNRKFPLAALSPFTLSSLTITAGDRLCIERGWRQSSTSVANGGVSSRSGAASDMPEDEAATNVFNDWVEFSQNLVFLSGAIAPFSSKMRMGLELGA